MMTLHEGHEHMNTLLKKENVNLNTMVAIVGFLGMFAGFVGTWTSIQYKQSETQHWQEDHRLQHEKLAADGLVRYTGLITRLDLMQDAINEMEQLKYRITLTEKGIENAETRTNRIVESSANQFTAINAQLAVLNTQIALANDSLKRLEAYDPRGPREIDRPKQP